MFNCDICSKICKSKAGLTNHKKVHKEVIFDENKVVIQDLII